jgi:hypothetical protein
MPRISNGPDWPPVNGSLVPVGVKTVVEVTTDGFVVDVVPWPCSVVLVVERTTVDPATCVELVVEPGTVVLVEVVVSWPGVVVSGVVVVVDVDVVVRASVVVVVGAAVVVVSWGNVVVSCGNVVVVGRSVVVVQPHFVVLVGGDVVVVEQRQLVDVLLDDVLLEDELLVGGVSEPQNCTLEMSGMLSLPTWGSPALENWPLVCGGFSDVMTADGPPFTITAETASVELQLPPDADVFESVTTCEFPDGESNE